MLPRKNDSYAFRRSNSTNSSSSSTRSAGMQHCRRKLQDTFAETEKKDNLKAQVGDKSVLSVLSINDNTRKALRNGAERLSKTINNMRTTLGTITQRFKISTKRRQILEEGPTTPGCATPHTFAKKVLGRTPTKMYSPFGIESPYNRATTFEKENVPPNQRIKNLER